MSILLLTFVLAMLPYGGVLREHGRPHNWILTQVLARTCARLKLAGSTSMSKVLRIGFWKLRNDLSIANPAVQNSLTKQTGSVLNTVLQKI